jgi:tetratricopeptide (TPR) repeat protein
VDVLALTREVDDPEGIASSLGRLGDVHRLLGELGRAREELAGAAELSERHGFGYFAAEAYVSLAAIDLEEGLPDAAHRHADLALAAARSVEHAHAAARASFAEALARHAAGRATDPAPADLLRSVAAEFATLGVDGDRADALGALARVLLEDGHLPAACTAVDELLALLAGGAPAGTMEPGRPLVDAHRVLTAVGDPRAADVAAAARDLLAARTTVVRDPAVRAAVLARPVARALAVVAAEAPSGA